MPTEPSSVPSDSLLMPSEGETHPSLPFQMPTASGRAEGTFPLPSETLSQSEAQISGGTLPDLTTIGVQSVADRVYELMKAELTQARRRGELSRRSG